jgi:hypothetical protein
MYYILYRLLHLIKYYYIHLQYQISTDFGTNQTNYLKYTKNEL